MKINFHICLPRGLNLKNKQQYQPQGNRTWIAGKTYWCCSPARSRAVILVRGQDLLARIVINWLHSLLIIISAKFEWLFPPEMRGGGVEFIGFAGTLFTNQNSKYIHDEQQGKQNKFVRRICSIKWTLPPLIVFLI